MCFPLFLSCLSSCLQSCRSAKEAKDFVSGAIASSAHLALGNGTQGPMNHSHLHCTRHRYTQQLKSFEKVGSENQKLKFVLCFCVVSVLVVLVFFEVGLTSTGEERSEVQKEPSASSSPWLRRNARSEEVVRDGTGGYRYAQWQDVTGIVKCFQGTCVMRLILTHWTFWLHHFTSISQVRLSRLSRLPCFSFVNHLYISHRFTCLAILYKNLYKNLYFLFFTHSLHLSITFHRHTVDVLRLSRQADQIASFADTVGKAGTARRPWLAMT